MTDENKGPLKLDDQETTDWERIPRAVRLVVYEQLRSLAATSAKDAAMQRTVAATMHETAPLAVPTVIAVAAAHALASEAYMTAVETLLESDSEICLDCMDYHESGASTVHKKDLS